MQDTRPLSALAYLSIFFAPFIVPIIVFFLSKDTAVRGHAKRAFISHIFPVLSAIIVFSLFAGAIFTNNEAMIGGSLILAMIVVVGVNLAVVIYNIYKAVRLYV